MSGAPGPLCQDLALRPACVLSQQFFVLAAQFLGLAPEGDLGGPGQGDLGRRPLSRIPFLKMRVLCWSQ
jgi:hypothetical protein